MKRCSKCAVEKQWTAEFFPRDRSQACGFAHRCKECDRAARLASTNPERNSSRAKTWARENRARHAEICRIAAKERRQNSPELRAKIARKNVMAFKRRYSSDPVFRAKHNLRVRLRELLRAVDAKKAANNLIGCSPTELRAYLQAAFQPGMSWDNYGSWHVDHVRPLASFDLRDPEQQRIAFRYTNLQPLWARDNLEKGARWAA